MNCSSLLYFYLYNDIEPCAGRVTDNSWAPPMPPLTIRRRAAVATMMR